jgi:hypothetical protein
MDTLAMTASTRAGGDMRATPAGRPDVRGHALQRHDGHGPRAPSAILACSGVTTSMMTPPLSISARPVLRDISVMVVI